MKLRLGQPVRTSDGPFGRVGDIVVDPHERTVTHLVVEPDHQHYQARLVPMSLVEVVGDEVSVQLDEAHLRQLETVSFFDFVRPGDPIELADGWEIGTEDFVVPEYWGSELGPDLGSVPLGDQMSVSYDRIPKGECEIRRRSEVMTSDEHLVGHVEGFLSDADHLTGLAVRSGLPGRRRIVVVPMSSVAKVRSDWIRLDLDRAGYRKLPASSVFEERVAPSWFSGVERRAAGVAQLVGNAVVGVAARVQKLLGRSEHE